MTQEHRLEAVLQRMAEGKCTPDDMLVLAEAVKAGQLAVAGGDRSVSIAGGVSETVVITGDKNVVVEGADAQALRRALGEPFGPALPGLLSYGEFSARCATVALAPRTTALLGRRGIIDAVRAHLAGRARVILLHGPGGVGKTRLLLALRDTLPERARLLYARAETTSVERDIHGLDRSQSHIIVVDDAHRFGPLYELRELLVNPELAGRSKIVLATRSAFRTSVPHQLGTLPDDEIAEIEVAPLTDGDIDELLRAEPLLVEREDLRRTIVRVAEGNPLFARIGARLVQQGQAVSGLSRDGMLTRYLEDIVHDLAETGLDESYLAYLRLLAALRAIDLGNKQLRSKVREVAGVTPQDEDRIIAGLVNARLVEKHWMTLRIPSEVLADHILLSHYFDPEVKRADYRRDVLEPFIQLAPKQILTSLAEAEVKGETDEAGRLLTEQLDSLCSAVREQGNIVRYNVLEWVQDLAYLRPDDGLAIVAGVVEAGEAPPETPSGPLWFGQEFGHWNVLDKCVDILRRTAYRGDVRAAARYLHRIARSQDDDRRYEHARRHARDALVALAEFQPGKPYAIQMTLLDLIPEWLEEDYAGNLELALAVLGQILNLNFTWCVPDIADNNKVVVRTGVLNPTQALVEVRQRALSVLIDAYPRARSLSERLQVLKLLPTSLHTMPTRSRSPEVDRALAQECVAVAAAVLKTVMPSAELPVLEVISEWFRSASDHLGADHATLRPLRMSLERHELYRLYRLLIGTRLEMEEPEFDWRKAQERRLATIDGHIAALDLDMIPQFAVDLSTIAEQARIAGEHYHFYYNQLLMRLAEQRPRVALQLVAVALERGLGFKPHLGYVAAGLYRSAPKEARGLTDAWVDSGDPDLWLAVAVSGHFGKWHESDAEDRRVLRALVAKESKPVDFEVLRLIWPRSRFDPRTCVQVLQAVAKRGDTDVIHQLAEVTGLLDQGEGAFAIEREFADEFVGIVQAFKRLPSLDHDVQRCLDKLAQVDPMLLIQFVEDRIDLASEQQKQEHAYDAIPFQFLSATESIRGSPRLPDVLRHVRDWMLRDDGPFSLEAPSLLSQLAPGLAGPMREVLMEWIEDGARDELWAVLRVLREFNSGRDFYDLCREIIVRVDDDDLFSEIACIISTTPSVVTGSMAGFFEQRLEEVSPWLSDEDHRVRRFGQRMAQYLRVSIEREQARDALEKRSLR